MWSCVVCSFYLPVAYNQVKSSKLSSSGKRSAEVCVHVHVRVFSSCALYIVPFVKRWCVCMCRMHLGMVKLQMLLLRRSDKGIAK